MTRALGLLLVVLALGCGAARRAAPLAGPLTLSASAREGQRGYMRFCEQCHPGGEASTGPALNNKNLPRAVMKLQVREGVLGTMPSFDDTEIPDAQLDKIFDYVETLRAP